MNKKGQLGWIEFKFMLIGLVVGVLLAAVLIYLLNNGILLPKMAFLCPGSK